MICCFRIMQDDLYCSRCAATLDLIEIQGIARPVCVSCGKVVYHDPKLASTVVLEQRGKILMVRRATEPGFGLWSFPGGYVERGEVIELAAAREVLEETGLKVDITGLVGVFSKEEHAVVLLAFGGRIVSGFAKAGSEVSDLRFFHSQDLPPLAFPTDIQVLDAWEKFKNRRDLKI